MVTWDLMWGDNGGMMVIYIYIIKLIPIYNKNNKYFLYTINKLERIHKLENRREYGDTLEDHVHFMGII